jgi:hypothetical protein
MKNKVEVLTRENRGERERVSSIIRKEIYDENRNAKRSAYYYKYLSWIFQISCIKETYTHINHSRNNNKRAYIL